MEGLIKETCINQVSNFVYVSSWKHNWCQHPRMISFATFRGKWYMYSVEPLDALHQPIVRQGTLCYCLFSICLFMCSTVVTEEDHRIMVETFGEKKEKVPC